MHTLRILSVFIICVFSGLIVEAQTDSLYQTIARLDSIYFDAYNKCDIPKQSGLYADSIEFYHDKGGLTTSKSDLLESIKKNVCGKLARELVAGSIEVYPIPGYGAVELGMHTTYNKEESSQKTSPSKFVIIWRNTGNTWLITRAISLHP